MFRFLLLFGVMSSLIAAGQAVGSQTGAARRMTTAQQPAVVAPVGPVTYGNGLYVNSGYVTTVPVQGPVNPPLLSPPNIALPGSGPATGAPPSVDVNNAREGGTGDVVFPGVGDVSPALNGAPPEEPGPAGTRGDLARSGVLNTGLGKFVGNPEVVVAAVTQKPSASLADVARMYKARRAVDHPKEFDNAKLEGRYESTPQNNVAPQSASNEAPAAANEPAQNQQAALDQRDLAIVEGELARSRAQAANNAAGNQGAQSSENVTIAQANQPQASNQAARQGSNQPANAAATAPQAPQSNANAQAKTQKKQQLPASASPLPMLGLMGLLAAGAGAVYAFRART